MPDVFSWVKPSLLSLSALANNGGIEASPNLGGVQTIKPGEQITLGSEIAGAQFIWSTGVTTPTITVSSPGEYTVTVTNQAGCRKVENVTVRNAKNINQGGIYLDWGVCPNPASDFVQIVFPEEALFSPCQMVLSDALGRVLKETPMKYARTKLDLQELPNGFYWLELRRDGKSLGSTKIIHAKQ